jgi:flavin reductase (DIM6/NTAB) family NADH-FMN oxidoreductase RutF
MNLAPYSFFNAFLYDPPIIGFSSISWKDTVKNVSETREFVWNLVTMDLGERMNVTATPLDHGISEFEAAGLTPMPGRHVAVPRVGESMAAMECKVVEVSQLANAHGEKVEGWFVLGRGGDYLEVKTENMFEIKRPPGSSKPEFHGS